MTDPKRPDHRDQPTPGADRGPARGAQGASDAGGAAHRRAGDEDARFGGAWRSQSNEEPPPALDAALRAAARREVGARVKTAAVPEATRPERWWFPLAAAATIGAIAIGLLQVVTPDRMESPGGDARSVSDVPPGATSVEAPTAKPPAPPPARPAEEWKVDAAGGLGGGTSTETAAAQGTTQRLPSQTTPAQASAVKVETDGASRVTPSAPSSAMVEAQVQSRVAADVPSKVTAPSASAPTTVSAEAARRDGTPQPFPAIAGKPQGEPAPVVGAPSSPAPPSAVPPFTPSSASPPSSGAAASLAPVADSPGGAPVPPPAPRPAPLAASPTPPRAAAQYPAPSAAVTSAPTAAPMAKLGAAREQSDRAVAPRAADMAEGAAGANRARSEIAQRAVELPVPEWIALIRRLRDEGKFVDVDRELKAFRAAHPDHLTLLPPDLRDWRLPP